MEQHSGLPTALAYVWTVWRARWWILGFFVVSVAAAYGYGKTLPPEYEARATILAPRESAGGLSASIGALFMGGEGRAQQLAPGVSFAMPVGDTTLDLLVAQLKSRTVRETVVAELAKTWGPTVGSQLVSVQVDTKQKGVVSVTVGARDPQLAADAANAFFTQLDTRMVATARVSLARQERVYREQLAKAGKEVEAAEETLLKFQAEHRYVGADASTKVAADQAAGIRGQIMGLELQLEVMRLRFTDSHSQVVEIKKQIAGLKQQYSKELFGAAMDLPPESPAARAKRKEFFVPVAQMTPTQFAFVKLYRNLKIQDAFYTAALQGLQQMQYQGTLGFPEIQFLDPAVPPNFRSAPKLKTLIMMAALGALLVALGGALLVDWIRTHDVLGALRAARPRRRAAPAATAAGGGMITPGRAAGAPAARGSVPAESLGEPSVR